ncbi:NtaA/DmoA family FMN-dependent monooxygenase [Jiangella endophytica]|uniref:NtaA/DmoA family FMN-dependent monooxygenase n=1 Tax=Jiangella endophytica TaxID=1623398 RepID=UPI00130075DA|nr:NtaA/DmoA family FMN-dependent monooxygenase [Jiangella endophytica]
MTRRLLLNFNIDPIGHHHAAWRHPDTDPRLATDFEYYARLTTHAEDAGVDAVFIADGLSHRAGDTWNPVLGFEPFTLFSGLAARTNRIGLILTVSSTFSPPYTVARQFASLEHLSGGRSGMNIVTTTSDAAARNYGLDALPDHPTRYRRAHEFTRVLVDLWRSWDADALAPDAAANRFVRDGAVRPIDHVGEFYRIDGPLNSPRSPQGRPVIVQAGSSEDGRDFAARHADVVYTISQSLDTAQEFYRDVKGRAAGAGRDPGQVKILLGVRVLVEPERAAARAKAAELNDLLPYEHKLAGISRILEVDLTTLAPDDPLPPLPAPRDGHRFQTQLVMVRALVEHGEVRTAQDLIERLDGGQGVSSITGDPGDVADHLEEWFAEGAADGFTILPQVTQSSGPNVLDLVVPELRRRGLVGDPPPGRTLKERLGLRY